MKYETSSPTDEARLLAHVYAYLLHQTRLHKLKHMAQPVQSAEAEGAGTFDLSSLTNGSSQHLTTTYSSETDS